MGIEILFPHTYTEHLNSYRVALTARGVMSYFDATGLSTVVVQEHLISLIILTTILNKRKVHE